MNWHYVFNILTGELLHSSADRPTRPVVWPIVLRDIDFYPDPLTYIWDADLCSYQLRVGADPEKSKHLFLEDEDSHGL